VCGNVVVLS
jgi:hypothetical protein